METDTTEKSEMKRVEFHRNAVALMPDDIDEHPGVAFFYFESNRPKTPTLFCTCRKGGNHMCSHMRALERLSKAIFLDRNENALYRAFRESFWYKMAEAVSDFSRLDFQDVKRTAIRSGDASPLFILDGKENLLSCHFSTGEDRNRLSERLTRRSEEDLLYRGEVIERLRKMTLTESESQLIQKGIRSRHISLEGTFWYRVCYHLFREHGENDIRLQPSVDEKDGAFMVSVSKEEDRIPLCSLSIPRNAVFTLLKTLDGRLPNQHGMPIHPIPVESLFKISRNTELDIDVRPVIRLMQKNGTSALFDRGILEKFRYGCLVYIKELKIMAQLVSPSKGKSFTVPQRMTFKKYQIPEFLDSHKELFHEGKYLIDETAGDLRIIRSFDHIEVAPHAIDRDWCYLDIRYAFGDKRISLCSVLQAKKKNERYIRTEAGWIDLSSEAFDDLISIDNEENANRDNAPIKVSRLSLLELKGKCDTPVVIAGNMGFDDLAKNIMALIPSSPCPVPHLTSTLRAYQTIGFNWLWYLYENRFGGLLCDDMGLGKTHQIIALMTALKEKNDSQQPILVVCPASVLSHWQDKILTESPNLRTMLYHGGERRLEKEGMDDASLVFLTTYGILLRDADILSGIPFSLAVFDEIQHLKNDRTKAHIAACRLNAAFKVGLTGTPIENSLAELKALMDIVLPGYLGKDDTFRKKYILPIEQNGSGREKERLQRIVSPFILRRMKASVLFELPDKIEDKRYCELTPDQVRLYRDAIERRASDILCPLKEGSKSLPYFHLFALLGLLKQICNHPATVAKSQEEFESYRSGKWELFREILDEALSGGHKVIVFSQYLAMIDIFRLYLEKEGIGHSVLTGASRDRKKIIDAFNTDPSIRVFVGSLRAGGSGIDLTGGNLVIHYDRWWNAAKEEQATDRCYRIGQKKGVQVFKLITKGTLEEKIDAIIERKKERMKDLIHEDDANFLKIFTPDELMDILSIHSIPLSV